MKAKERGTAVLVPVEKNANEACTAQAFGHPGKPRESAVWLSVSQYDWTNIVVKFPNPKNTTYCCYVYSRIDGLLQTEVSWQFLQANMGLRS